VQEETNATIALAGISKTEKTKVYFSWVLPVQVLATHFFILVVKTAETYGAPTANHLLRLSPGELSLSLINTIHQLEGTGIYVNL
jgi:hypothetical protein